MTDTRRPAGFLHLALLGAVVVLIVDQVSLLASQLAPIRPTDLPWRFGAVGIATSRATAFLLADVLLLLVVQAAVSRWPARVLGVAHLLVALALVALLPFFGLDAMEMRHAANLESVPTLTLQAGRAGAMLLLLAAFSTWVGILLLRLHAGAAGERARPTQDEKLVVGAERRREAQPQ